MFKWLQKFKTSPIPKEVVMNQNNKILILGARGNLGSQMRDVLANAYRLLLWGRDEMDVSNFQVLKAKIREHKPNVIINCVAYNAVDKCEEEEGLLLARELNRDLPKTLAEISQEIGAIFVHYSTDYVFDGEKDEYKEDSPTNPVSKYGQSKTDGEKEILKFAGSGLKYYIVRTSKLFGPRGESANAKENFFDLVLRLSESQDEFKMIDGEEISCFTYTRDLARATKEMIESGAEPGIYHIVNEGEASWCDGAKFVLELKNIKNKKIIPIKSIDMPRPAKRPRRSVLVNTKLPKLRTWQEALEEYLK